MCRIFQTSLQWLIFSLLVLLAAACGKVPESTYQPEVSQELPKNLQKKVEYTIAIVPEGSQMRVAEAYGPLINYLNARIQGATLILIGPRNHAELDGSLSGRRYNFALVNALQVLQSNARGYQVIAKKGDDDQFYGIFLVRRDSGIQNVGDLKGKKVSYPSPTGVAATVLPKHFLMTHGLNISRDIENLYVGSHEASIMHVYSGKAAAGAAREFSWKAFQKKHPEEAAELKLKWKTEPLIDQAIIARNDVPTALNEQIAKLLIGMSESAEGQGILMRIDTSKFVSANNASYAAAGVFFSKNADLLQADVK